MDIKTENYKFVQNRDCEFFPCHQGVAEEDFNCLFCYCPLYALGEECKGGYSYENKRGIKDCSGCITPHLKKNYDYINDKLKILIERSSTK